MSKIKSIGAIIFVSVFILAACWERKWDDLHPLGQKVPGAVPCVVADTVLFSATISTIISSNCANTSGCHNTTLGLGNGAFDYSATPYVANNSNNLFKDCRNDTSSNVWQYITGASGDQMPLGRAPLTPCDMAKIKNWLLQGAPAN